jgi:hypothetical protein
VGVVGGTEAMRFQVFADLFPNTIHAKMHAPYHPDRLSSLAKSSFMSTLEVVKSTPLLFASLIFILCTRYSCFQSSFHMRSELSCKSLFLASPLFGVIAFNSAIGINSGYTGRMQTLAFPFAFLLLGFWSEKLGLFRQKSQRPYVITACTGTVLVSWLVSAREPLAQAYSVETLQREQDLVRLTPKRGLIPTEPVKRIGRQVGQANKVTCEIVGWICRIYGR